MMPKNTMIVLSALVSLSGVAMMEIGERALTTGVFALFSLVVVFLYRRFSRLPNDVPWVFAAVAAIGVTLGVVTLISGVVHSVAVTAVAFNEGQWLPLTVLRFTTGAMLIYAGVTSIVVHRAIRRGQSWAVKVGAGTSLVFWLYLMLLLPLPGTGGTVPPMFGLWSAYLAWLSAAVVLTVQQEAVASRELPFAHG